MGNPSRSLIIGMDEAGYGPNLGPLIVGATAWEVPSDVPAEFDLWHAFTGIVAQTAPAQRAHIQIADSKQVYTPGKGLNNLEAGVLSAMLLQNRCESSADDDHARPAVEDRPLPVTLSELVERVAIGGFEPLRLEPWFAEGCMRIEGLPADSRPQAWRQSCRSQGIALPAMRCDVVLTRRFNDLTRSQDSKGRALSEISLKLLRHVWDECQADQYQHVLILADKHGGRNRYHEFLPILFGDQFIRALRESRESSRYRVGNAEIRFETKSERHLPVALASMLCKYVRELSMEHFNQFWCSRQPGLKPTAGYPLDAVRFKQEIAALQERLGIATDDLWRER
ncbi:MAG: hypothetical protein JSS02_20170 [Planctomycetes bacterium]|nr:hypothetical protein [Planctomycetota bacterium]